MASNNTSAVLDIVSESKEISSILKDYERSSNCSDSLVQSPSLESFSTLQDIENLSELHMDENSDLSVKVDNPQKHLETLETYITFRITTKVARIEYSENEYVVRRRYNDFIWLRQKLVDGHPFCIIPPLPGKHSLIGQLDRYSKDFILLRMKALNVFISRIGNHPILSCSEYFKAFLTAKQSDFNLHRKQRNCVENKIRSLSHSNSTYSALKNRHLEFDKVKNYLSVLSEKLLSIEKISSRINKERVEFVSELTNFYPIFSHWATVEPDLSDLLHNIGNAVERNTAAHNMLVQSYANTIGNPIREFLTYIEVVQETVKKRESFQCAYENSLEDLNKRHSEKDKLLACSQNQSQVSTGFSLWKQSSFDDKLEKLGVYIPQLVKKVETTQDSLECANECLRSDLEHWHIEKKQCLKAILLDFVNKQIEFYQGSVSAWEHVLHDITPQNNITK